MVAQPEFAENSGYVAKVADMAKEPEFLDNWGYVAKDLSEMESKLKFSAISMATQPEFPKNSGYAAKVTGHGQIARISKQSDYLEMAISGCKYKKTYESY